MLQGQKLERVGIVERSRWKEGTEAMVILCFCDLERGKYVFADLVEISVEEVEQVSFSPSHCMDLSLGFSLVCSEHSLSSHKLVTRGKSVCHCGTPELNT